MRFFPLFACFSLASSFVYEVTYSLDPIKVVCYATFQQQQQLRSVYGQPKSSHESPDFNLPLLPHCSLSKKDNSFSISGMNEQSSTVVENLKVLLSGKFLPKLKTTQKEYLKIIGTKFLLLSYVRSAVNLCAAIRERRKRLVCVFLDVTSDPMLLVGAEHRVPWIEVKLDHMEEPIIITDPFPTFASTADRLGLGDTISESEVSRGISRVPQCSAEHSDISLCEEVLLYTETHWREYVLPLLGPTKPHVRYLGETGIPHAPDSVIRLLEHGSTEDLTMDLVYVVFLIEDCMSCTLAHPPLTQLKERARAEHASLFFLDCEHHEAACAGQGVHGFPALLAYQITPQIAGCPAPGRSITTTAYHGVFRYEGLQNHAGGYAVTEGLGEWFRVVNSQGVHRGEPHSFHSTCNVHVVIHTTSTPTTDHLRTDCFRALCRELSYAECFLPGEEVGEFVESVELKRRDRVESVIYRDGVSLHRSFTDSPSLHALHGTHEEAESECHVTPAECVARIREFIAGHSRTVVTELTPLLFHSPVSYGALFGDLPVLVAMVPHETALNMSSPGKDDPFVATLYKTATEHYSTLATAYVDVGLYPMWVSGMSPARRWTWGEWVYQFPRVLVFRLDNHGEAAFLKVTGEALNGKTLREFIGGVLGGVIEMELCDGI